MRPFLCLCLVLPLLSAAAFAATDAPSYVAPKTTHHGEMDASLSRPADRQGRNTQAVRMPNKAVKKPGPLWMSLPRERRERILQGWQSLPETTRPPFPVYLEQQCQTPQDASAPRPSSPVAKKNSSAL